MVASKRDRRVAAVFRCCSFAHNVSGTWALWSVKEQGSLARYEAHMQPHTLTQSLASASASVETGGQGNVQNMSAPLPLHSTQQPSASSISTPARPLTAPVFEAAREASCSAEAGRVVSKPASSSMTMRSTCSFFNFLPRPFLITPAFGPHRKIQFNACAACMRGGRLCNGR